MSKENVEVSEDQLDQVQVESEEVVADDIESKIAAKTKQLEASEAESVVTPEVVYSPNYEYKVYDKAEQMPDWARPYVTSKEAEENLRTLFSKSGAFDPLKEKHEGLRAKYEEENSKVSKIYETLDQLQYFIDNDDLDSFFEKVKIPEDKLIQHIKRRLQLDEMPKDQRQLYDQNRDYVKRTWEQERDLANYQAQNQALLRNQHEFEYSKTLSLPEVSSFQQKFDEKLGAGAFRKHADSYGDIMYHQTSRNIAPLEAVRYVMDQYKGLFTEPVSQQETVSQVPAMKRPGGHIPNIGKGASQASPTTKRFNSIEDLREHIKSQAVNE